MSLPALRVSDRELVRPFPVRLGLQPRVLAILALFSANAIWAGSAVASKAALATMHPLTMTSARTAIAVVILGFLVHRRDIPIATGRVPALLGLTGVGVFGACQNVGLLFADATTTALLGAATPILTMALAVPMLGERLSGLQVLGVTVALAGVSLIVLLGTGNLGGASTVANVLPLASAVCFALYNVVGRRAFRTGNTLALVAGGARYGLLFLLPLTVWEFSRTDPAVPSMQGAALVLYLGAGCSVAAFLLSGYGLSHMAAGHGGIYGNLKPVVGVILAVTLLGEPLRAVQIAGGMLVLLGIGIASWTWLRDTGSSAGRAGMEASRPGGNGEFSHYDGLRRAHSMTSNPDPSSPTSIIR